MSFLSVLKGLGKGIGSALPIVGPIVSGIGALGKGAANQRSSDRGAQTEYNLLNDRNRLDFARFNQGADTANLRRGVSADLLGGYQRPTDPRAQKFFSGGGVSPEMLQRLRATQTPQLGVSPQPQPGKGDTFLRTLGMAGTAMDAMKLFGLLNHDDDLPPEPQTGSLEDWKKQQQKGGYA